jgi:SRSO17 transposase
VRTAHPGPSPQEKRFAAYLEGLAKAAGHRDRQTPLKDYCRGLLLPGERKSVEPMAARLHPDRVQAARQSLHHLVAKACWSDQAVLEAVRRQVLPAMTQRQPVVAWIVDDTGIPKKGRHSVGVARQYCGQLGKQDNCQVAVTLSVASWQASLPVAYRLYLPREWAEDRLRRRKAGVPEEVEFQTKPAIALEQIRQALEAGLPCGVVLADAGYGADTGFRAQLGELGLAYVVGVQGGVSLWRPGEQPLPAKPRGNRGRPPKRLRRVKDHRPVSARELVLELGPKALRTVAWRQGAAGRLSSRFVAVRVRPAHRDYWRSAPHPEQWLLAEWPRGAAEPVKYWLSNLPARTPLKQLVRLAKHRWIVERDYLELKQELGLGHFEGRSWRGFHHHATLCIAAYGFLVAERSRFSPSARSGQLKLSRPRPPENYRPRGSPEDGAAG